MLIDFKGRFFVVCWVGMVAVEVHSLSGIFTLTYVEFFTVGTYDAVINVVCVTGYVFVWFNSHPVFQRYTPSREKIVMSIFAKTTFLTATHFNFVNVCSSI